MIPRGGKCYRGNTAGRGLILKEIQREILRQLDFFSNTYSGQWSMTSQCSRTSKFFLCTVTFNKMELCYGFFFHFRVWLHLLFSFSRDHQNDQMFWGVYESHAAEKFYARTTAIDYPRLSNVVLRIASLMLFVFGVGGAVQFVGG
jgi:hypothetical protein